jgi:hypothetical protein
MKNLHETLQRVLTINSKGYKPNQDRTILLALNANVPTYKIKGWWEFATFEKGDLVFSRDGSEGRLAVFQIGDSKDLFNKDSEIVAMATVDNPQMYEQMKAPY